jgi:hypothetical protein
MCDYSLHLIASRPAKVADRLVSTDFGISITRGFAEVGEPDVAVCLLPGTELAFDNDVQFDRAFRIFGKTHTSHRVARFRQINMDDPYVHHDALEFPDGQVLLVTRLAPGQTATVLQLPASAGARTRVGRKDIELTAGAAPITRFCEAVPATSPRSQQSAAPHLS